jgi:hypothetical protein
MASHEHIWVIDPSRDAGLFGIIDQMIEKHAKSSAASGAKRSHDLLKIVSAVKEFNDNTLDS